MRASSAYLRGVTADAFRPRWSKVERVLARLDEAAQPRDMNLPGFRLHPLRGDLAGYWAVAVSGN